MIRPLEVHIEEESKRARFSLIYETPPNDLQVTDSFTSLQMLNLNECCHFLNVKPEESSIDNDASDASILDNVHLDDLAKNNLNTISNGDNENYLEQISRDTSSTGVRNESNVNLLGEDNGLASEDRVNSNVVDVSEDMSVYRKNNLYPKACKSLCDNERCSESIYCSSPNHKNRFYHFKSITTEQDGDVMSSLPNTPAVSASSSVPDERSERSFYGSKKCLASNYGVYFKCGQGAMAPRVIYGKKIPKSCMNGPMGVYPSPRRYPKTSVTQAKNCTNPPYESSRTSADHAQQWTESPSVVRRRPCPVVNCNTTTGEPNIHCKHKFFDMPDCHDASTIEPFHRKHDEDSPLPYFTSKSKSSSQNPNKSASCNQQNLPGPLTNPPDENDASGVHTVADSNSLGVQASSPVHTYSLQAKCKSLVRRRHEWNEELVNAELGEKFQKQMNGTLHAPQLNNSTEPLSDTISDHSDAMRFVYLYFTFC